MAVPTHVTFVPGAAGLGSFWDPVAAALPNDWSARSLDLPGLGHSPAHPEINSYLGLVEHVARSVARPGVLAAQSMGCYLALELCLRHPALVTHLVLAVAAGGVDMQRLGALDWRPSYHATHTAAQPWANASVPDLTDELKRIRVPVLLVWASRDAISPLTVARHLKAQLPNAHLLEFDTDDHWVARRFPTPIANAIVDLARGTLPTAPVAGT